MLRWMIPLSALLLGLAVLPMAKPAQAGSGPRLCMVNKLTQTVHARVDYTPREGAQTVTPWVNLRQGERILPPPAGGLARRHGDPGQRAALADLLPAHRDRPRCQTPLHHASGGLAQPADVHPVRGVLMHGADRVARRRPSAGRFALRAPRAPR